VEHRVRRRLPPLPPDEEPVGMRAAPTTNRRPLFDCRKKVPLNWKDRTLLQALSVTSRSQFSSAEQRAADRRLETRQPTPPIGPVRSRAYLVDLG
jgi:hypothetical protein